MIHRTSRAVGGFHMSRATRNSRLEERLRRASASPGGEVGTDMAVALVRADLHSLAVRRETQTFPVCGQHTPLLSRIDRTLNALEASRLSPLEKIVVGSLREDWNVEFGREYGKAVRELERAIDLASNVEDKMADFNFMPQGQNPKVWPGFARIRRAEIVKSALENFTVGSFEIMRLFAPTNSVLADAKESLGGVLDIAHREGLAVSSEWIDKLLGPAPSGQGERA